PNNSHAVCFLRKPRGSKGGRQTHAHGYNVITLRKRKVQRSSQLLLTIDDYNRFSNAIWHEFEVKTAQKSSITFVLNKGIFLSNDHAASSRSVPGEFQDAYRLRIKRVVVIFYEVKVGFEIETAGNFCMVGIARIKLHNSNPGLRRRGYTLQHPIEFCCRPVPAPVFSRLFSLYIITVLIGLLERAFVPLEQTITNKGRLYPRVPTAYPC